MLFRKENIMTHAHRGSTVIIRYIGALGR